MKKNGYSLVEVLVAVSILMLSIIGPITIAAKSIQSAQYVRQQTTAFFLAQEGITIANTLRNNGGVDAYTDASVDAWGWISDDALAPCFGEDGCNIDFRDDTLLSNVESCEIVTDCMLLFDDTAPRAAYQLALGEPSPYTRILTFRLASAEEMIVESKVQWSSSLLGGAQEVSLSTSLFNLYGE